MGSYKEEMRDASTHTDKKFKVEKALKSCMAFLGSFLISMVGGLVLAWWELRFHPTNTQQWMVPFGLILFITPLLAWFLLFVSDICNFKDASTQDQPGFSVDNSVLDPELGMINPLHS